MNDISKLAPSPYTFLLKEIKEQIKNDKVYDNLINSSMGNYCINNKMNIIKYYKPYELSSVEFKKSRELNCLYNFQMIEIFNSIYHKEKSKLGNLIDKKVKGFTD